MELIIRPRLNEEFKEKADYLAQPLPKKRLIDRSAPIASLASGNNQFTAIADTDHSSGAIKNVLAAEMPQLVKAGVKHLMLEYTVSPIGHPLRNSFDEKAENILSRLNSRPPQITEQEIMSNAEFFSSSQEDPSTNETGKAYCNLLVSAMKAGMTVHFVGDHKGLVESMIADDIDQEKQNFLKKYAKLERFSQRLDKDPDFIKNLDWPEKEKRALETRITTHRDTLGKIKNRLDNADRIYEEERLGLASEQERADRFVKLANGEKSVVVFGRDHFNNKFDLNETIDMATKLDALKSGRSIPAKTPVVEIYADQKGLEKSMNIDAYKKDGKEIIDPVLRIFADSGKIEIPESSQKDFAFKPIAQTPPTLSYTTVSTR